LITIFAKILAVVSPFSAVIYYVSAPEMGNYKPRRFKARLANFHQRYSKIIDGMNVELTASFMHWSEIALRATKSDTQLAPIES
jgi:hypothetical protein